MPQSAFHDWRPALRPDIHLRDDPDGDVILVGPRGSFLGALDQRWRPILAAMDGRRTVGELLTEDAGIFGRFDPRGLTGLLLRLAGLGAFSEARPRIPVAEARSTVMDRLMRGLGHLLDIDVMGPSPAPWNPGRLAAPIFGALVLTVIIAALFLFLDGMIRTADAGLSGALAATGAALGGLAISMTLRGMVRWYVLFISGRPARRAGLRFRLGLPFLDVSPRSAADLDPGRQVILSLAGLGALGAAGALLLLPAGGPLAAIAGRAALVALVIDLCPFARSDASLLIESAVGIRWLRGRTLHYLRHGLVARLIHSRASSGEEWRLLLVLVIWSVWTAVALPHALLPALEAILDVTGALLSGAMATDDAVLSVLGLALGLYMAAIFCVTSVFAVLLAASFLLSFLQVLVPSGDGTPTDPQPAALPKALAALGLSPDEGEANTEETQWLRLGPGDCYPALEQPLSAPALLVSGGACVVRTEISGISYEVADAGPGWLIPGAAPGLVWRWNLRTRSIALLLIFKKDPGRALSDRSRRIAEYEACPALWGLGPDGVRWATSFPEVVLSDGSAIPDDERVAVLLDGVVSRQGPDGETQFSASRILPRIGPGERFTVTGERARLLLLPMSEVMPVLSAWRSID